MKKIIVVTAIILSGTVLTANAASSGTITFNGQITDTTCDVTVDGQGASATVTLPTVSSSLLTSAGSVAGTTDFTMQLSNCSLGNNISKVSAYFQSGSTVDPATGHLLQTATSGASNVDLQLLDPGNSNQPIKAGDASQIAGNTTKNMTSDGTTTGTLLTTINLPYAVQYYATGAATAGTVTSSVVYNLQYQ